MSLTQAIDQHLKDALKSQDKERLSALRNIKSHLKNKIIDLRRDLTDAEALQILSTLAKQRRESIDAFQKAGRDDLVNKEQFELDLIVSYLPQPLTEAELSDLVQKAIAESQAQGPQDMGKVMKILVPQVTGKADGKVLSELVKKLLG